MFWVPRMHATASTHICHDPPEVCMLTKILRARNSRLSGRSAGRVISGVGAQVHQEVILATMRDETFNIFS